MPDDQWVLDKAQNAKRESDRVEFKQSFDTSDTGEWCEIIKDIIAMWNTKGGVILIGLGNRGCPSGEDLTGAMELDPADITNKIAKYTGLDFDYAWVQRCCRGNQPVAAIVVESGDVLVAFEKKGTYDRGRKYPECAFSEGVVYFRRASKSAPGSTEEIRAWFERRIAVEQKRWLDGIGKVFTAPPGSRIEAVPANAVILTDADEVAFRLTDEEGAQAVRSLDIDKTHPYRQKELLNKINKCLHGKEINSHDILCVRRVYSMDIDQNYCKKSKYGPRQYSEAFANWVTEKANVNAAFFEIARRAYQSREMLER